MTIGALPSPVAQFNKVLECRLPKFIPTHDSPGHAAITAWPRLLKSAQSLNAFPGPGTALGAGLLSICRQALWPQQGTSLRKTSQKQGLLLYILSLRCLQMSATQFLLNVSVPKGLCAPLQPVCKRLGSQRVSPANADCKGPLQGPAHTSLLHLPLGPMHRSSFSFMYFCHADFEHGTCPNTVFLSSLEPSQWQTSSSRAGGCEWTDNRFHPSRSDKAVPCHPTHSGTQLAPTQASQ